MPNQGAYPPDYSTAVGQFRALIGDTEAENVSSGQGEYSWYGDAEIDGLLYVYSDNVKRASAQALRTVAASQALLLKKFSTDDLSVDGPAITRALRDLAKDLDAQADGADSSADWFEISTPGRRDLWPEGFPVPFGARVGRAVEDPDYPGEGEGTQDDGLWVV